jgi:hypothetical protein
MNNKKLILLGIVRVLAALFFAACSSGSKFPTGTFVSASDENREYVFNEDMTWAYKIGGLMSAKGTYKVDGNLWTEQGGPECPTKGTYQWSFDGKNLTFKLDGVDTCAPRKEATDGQTFVLSK